MKIKELSLIAAGYQASELPEVSPHGRGHAYRTAILAKAIQLRVGGNVEMVVAAGLLHDVGRIHDKGDPMHGYRGVYYAIQAMMDPVWVNCMLPLNMSNKGMVTDIIIHHCEPGPGTFLEMQIVKDADKLDRVRFQGDNELSAVLDVDRLHFKDISADMILGAQALLGREEEWKL